MTEQPQTGITAPPPPSRTPLAVISAFLIVVAGFTAYLHCWAIPLQGEDLRLLAQSPALHRLVTVPDAFPEMPQAPLTLFSYALNLLLPGGAAGLHAFNLLIHLLNGVLLFLVCRKLLSEKTPEIISMLAGMLFAVHPFTAGSVNLIAGRPMILATAFALASMLFFLRAARDEEVSLPFLSASMLFYAMAFASHTALLALPFALAALDISKNGFSALKRHGRAHAAAFGLLIMLASVWRVSGLPAAADRVQGMQDVIRWQGALLLKLFNDFDLSAVMETLPGASPSTGTAAALLLLMAVAVAALLLLAFRSPAGAALMWALSAVCAVVCLTPEDTALSIRNLYFPLAGLMLILPWFFLFIRRQPLRVACGLGAALLIGGCLYLTWQNTARWQHPLELWQQECSREEAPRKAWEYLGELLEQELAMAPDEETRTALLQRSVEVWYEVLNPLKGDEKDTDQMRQRVKTLTRLGSCLRTLGQFEKALPHLTEALRLDPFNGRAALELAMLHTDPRWVAAHPESLSTGIAYYGQAEKLDALTPGHMAAYAMAAINTGEIRKGLPLLQRAQKLQPDASYEKLIERFAPLYQRMQQIEQQINASMAKPEDGLKTVELKAQLLLLEGRLLQASYLLETLMRQDKPPENAWLLLGSARAGLDQVDSFLADHGQGGTPGQWDRLIRQCAMQRRWDAALKLAEAGKSSEDAGALPRMRLADIALEMRDTEQAKRLLHEAAGKHPDNPDPWLRLADIATEVKEAEEAKRCIEEAEKRGAFPEAIKERRDRIGLDSDGTFKPVRSIIR